MSDIGTKKDRIRGEHCQGAIKRAKLTFLGIDRLIENIAAILEPHRGENDPDGGAG